MSKKHLIIVAALAMVLVAGIASATDEPNSAAVFERVFNDLPKGEVFLLKILQPDGRSTMATALEKPEQ